MPTTKKPSPAKGKDKVEKVMHEFKEGELESGKSGRKRSPAVSKRLLLR